MAVVNVLVNNRLVVNLVDNQQHLHASIFPNNIVRIRNGHLFWVVNVNGIPSSTHKRVCGCFLEVA